MGSITWFTRLHSQENQAVTGMGGQKNRVSPRLGFSGALQVERPFIVSP